VVILQSTPTSQSTTIERPFIDSDITDVQAVATAPVREDVAHWRGDRDYQFININCCVLEVVKTVFSDYGWLTRLAVVKH